MTDPPAALDPVAVVQVLVGLPHLDRPFEYLVPAGLDEQARPGVRVKVPFSGRDTDGFLVERRAEPTHPGRLAPLRRVVSAEPILTPTLLRLVTDVAERYGGTVSDVLRLAVPPRHARAEASGAGHRPAPGPDAAVGAATGETGGATDVAPGPWQGYPAGASFLRRIRAGEAPWAAWTALPATEPDLDWPAGVASAVAATMAGGRGCLVVVPDHRDVERVQERLDAVLGPGRHVRLTADEGPQARYRDWLRVRRGHVRCVVGTRSAAFAPVAGLGLVVCWDDGDDLYEEPRAPYPHTRDVLRLHARAAGAALLLGGTSRSVAVQQWVRDGICREIVAGSADIRPRAPRVVVAGEGTDAERDGPAARAHLPSSAWRTAREALQDGPVLVQVPRRGYLPALSCQGCRRRARCPACHGPLVLPDAGAAARCGWCRAPVPRFECPECGDRRLRAGIVGARRTAEELGRAFPDVPVQTSGAGHVLARVGPEPSLVVATPGAEPVADGGYRAALLLDAWAMLDRPVLSAAAEAVRRWFVAAALTRSRAEGGIVVVAGVPAETTLPAVEALVRWDPVWFADRDLDERAALSLPPTVWMGVLLGAIPALREAAAALELPPSTELIGPFPRAGGTPSARGPGETAGDQGQLLLRVPLPEAGQLTRALAALRATRSARRDVEPLQVRVGVEDALP